MFWHVSLNGKQTKVGLSLGFDFGYAHEFSKNDVPEGTFPRNWRVTNIQKKGLHVNVWRINLWRPNPPPDSEKLRKEASP